MADMSPPAVTCSLTFQYQHNGHCFVHCALQCPIALQCHILPPPIIRLPLQQPRIIIINRLGKVIFSKTASMNVPETYIVF